MGPSVAPGHSPVEGIVGGFEVLQAHPVFGVGCFVECFHGGSWTSAFRFRKVAERQELWRVAAQLTGDLLSIQPDFCVVRGAASDLGCVGNQDMDLVFSHGASWTGSGERH